MYRNETRRGNINNFSGDYQFLNNISISTTLFRERQFFHQR